MIKFQYKIFCLVFALFITLAVSAGTVQAQSSQDYYNQRLKILETCKDDEDCLRRSEKKARKQDVQDDESAEWESAEGFMDSTDEELAAMSVKELRSALNEAIYFRALDQAKTSLESSSRCGPHRDKAIESRDNLDELNSRVKNKTTNNYGDLATEFKDANTQAVKDYKNCYQKYLRKYSLLKQRYVLDHETHTSEYNNLVDFYDSISDLDAHIAQLEEEIRRRTGLNVHISGGDTVAAIANTHKRVEVLRGGRGKWSRVKRGYQLRVKDELRTGPRGRARFVIADRYQDGNAGPTVVNMGSDSHLQMTDFVVGWNEYTERRGVIGLLRGALRVFTKNWGIQSSFKVRTGASLCGIRGTEIAISYNPDTKAADYHLDHGDAYIETGGKQTTMTPRTSRAPYQTAFSALSVLWLNLTGAKY